jgi:hypothetical protein
VIEQILQADRFLKVDQVESAEAIYGRVAEADPGNAIAVVGLARCALARGDDRGAHELAARALGIDPENDMARRMEARLAEILTVRGQRVDRPESATIPGPREMRPVVAGDIDADTTAEPVATGAPVTAGRRPAMPAATPSTRRAPAVRKSFLDRLRGR